MRLAAATRPLSTRFLTVYGTSDNEETWRPRTGWDALGWKVGGGGRDRVQGPVGDGEVAGQGLGHFIAGGRGDQGADEVVGQIGLVPAG